MISSPAFSSDSSKKVLVYDDSCLGAVKRGTSLLGIRHTVSSLLNFFPKELIERITPSELRSGEKLLTARLLVIPGGRDRPYHKELKGIGNENIRSFVESGGSILGICAGAYYLSQRVEFTPKNLLFHLEEDRELGFYPGTCKGPALGDYNPLEPVGVKAAPLLLRDSSQEISVYYNGGGSFPEAKKFPGVAVLATYKETGSPAIIKMKVGEGTCLLTGVHLEYPADELAPCELKPGVKEELLFFKRERIAFLKHILQELGI